MGALATPVAPVREKTALFLFCGMGLGARGFLDAHVKILGAAARFRSLGGVDNNPVACENFWRITGSPALCADIATLTPDELRAFAGDDPPDAVFLSAPCKPFSGLMKKKALRLRKYRLMVLLAWQAMRLLMATWRTPPKLIFFENVPGIATRGRPLLRKLRSMGRAAGYVVSPLESHDCGAIAKPRPLAQHRRRALAVFRLAAAVPNLIYKPTKGKVRACGEELGRLPLPNDPRAGRLHLLPRISLRNWARLANIPPGGDHRDLAGVLAAHQKRHEAFRRHLVLAWARPSATIAGTGSNGPVGVVDPRRGSAASAAGYQNLWQVYGDDGSVGAITGATRPGGGAASVADARVPTSRYAHNMRLYGWSESVGAVIGATDIQTGVPLVADGRLTYEARGHSRRGTLGVLDPAAPTGAVTGNARPTTGAFSIADLRVVSAFAQGWGVVPWGVPCGAVTGRGVASTGAYSVTDLRIEAGHHPHTWGVLGWGQAAHAITSNPAPGGGPNSVADLRFTCELRNGFYGVLDWLLPAPCVTGNLDIHNGPAAVADPRWGVALPDGAAFAGPATHGGCDRGPTAGRPESRAAPKRARRTGTTAPSRARAARPWRPVARRDLADLLWVDSDMRIPGNPPLRLRWFPRDLDSIPPFAIVLRSVSGKWHRPLTLGERLYLQGYEFLTEDGPIDLAGSVAEISEETGNAVPVGTGLAMAEQALLTLLGAELEMFALSGDRDVWVAPHGPAPVLQ